ncbi:MAG: XdhC family protein [Coriobacteriales bacterium]|jgi:xanthine dehydrogenase accessory factor|nr:XdhC family protein [Coriobacteriales bacterium]
MPDAPKPTLKATLQAMIDALRAGELPEAGAADFPCFSEEALRSHVGVTPEAIQSVLASLSKADIPTLEEAIVALEALSPHSATESRAGAPPGANSLAGAPPGAESRAGAPGQPAWLGFKLVYDSRAALDSNDTEVVGFHGIGAGSANGDSGIFLVYEDGRVTCSRPYSERDRMQMLDCTRGPHMHSEQYAGITWLSLPLEVSGRVFIFGAGEVPFWLARYACDVGFETVVLDDDPAYLTQERFACSERVCLHSFTELDGVGLNIGAQDFVLVLTRGHMYDPEVLAYAVATDAHYVGMMGCLMKNERVMALAERAGVAQSRLQTVHAPVGLRFGAKTPPELAMCVVAELIEDRYRQRRIN